MAHTLQINGGTLASAIDLALGTAGAGYHLSADPSGYTPIEPLPETLYSASRYQDGNRPVFSRSGNIVETITVDIKGSSADDAFAKLRALKRILAEARDYMQRPGIRQPVYLSYKPHGTTNTAYSVLVGGMVTEPMALLDTPLNSYELIGVMVTIEREPFWREKPPVRSATVTDYSAAAAAETMINPWHAVSLTGATSVPGDIDALARLELQPTDPFDRVIAGYRSARVAGSLHSAAGVRDLTPGNSTFGDDATQTADVTALSGNMCRVSFAGTPGNAVRVTQDAGVVGSYRVFCRCKVTSGTATLYLAHEVNGVTVNNAAVTIWHTAYWFIDLGIINAPRGPASLTTAASSSDLPAGSLKVNAARASGSGSLDIDLLFLMPVDEYYLTASGVGAAIGGSGVTTMYRFDNIAPVRPGGQGADIAETGVYPVRATGDLKLPPGDGTLYAIVGYTIAGRTEIGSNIGARSSLYLWRCARYLSARGAG